MSRGRTHRAVVLGVLMALGLASAGCRARVGVGLSIPIGGGWGGPYGGLSMSVGIPIR